jgi:hypothetical protein
MSRVENMVLGFACRSLASTCRVAPADRVAPLGRRA